MKIRNFTILLLLAVMALWADGQQWIQTGLWNGCGVTETPVFMLEGFKWEVTYQSKFKEQAILEMVDAATGKTIAYQSSKMVNNRSFAIKGESHPDVKRMVFLRITGSTYGWNVKMTQYVSATKAFELHQRSKKAAKPLTKYGMWCGDGGERLSIPLEIPCKEWRIHVKTEAAGSFTLKCTDEQENILATTRVTGAGELNTWIHTSGGVTIEIISVDSPWTMAVEMP